MLKIQSTANIVYLYVLGVNNYFYCLRSPNITPYRRGSLSHSHGHQLSDDSTSSGKRRKVQRLKELEENTAVQKRDRQRELKYNTTIQVLRVHGTGGGNRCRSLPGVHFFHSVTWDKTTSGLLEGKIRSGGLAEFVCCCTQTRSLTPAS